MNQGFWVKEFAKSRIAKFSGRFIGVEEGVYKFAVFFLNIFKSLLQQASFVVLVCK